MKLYDFSKYAERREALRKERAAAQAVVEVISDIDRPGSVVRLKAQVDDWFHLHQSIIKKAG